MKVDRSIGLTALPEVYNSRIAGFENEKNSLERKSLHIAAGRLTLFILLALLVYLSITLKSPVLLIPSLMILSGFLYLVKRATIIRRKINFCQILINISMEEINALNGDFSAFDPGNGFIDYHHEYSFDLDIFGEHSIYRLISRAATQPGKINLAARLLYPGTEGHTIRARQEAVRELVDQLNWRHDFLATARESDWEKEPERQISNWLDAPDRFSKTLFYKIAVPLNASITLTLSLLYLLTVSFPAIFSFTFPPTAFIYFLLPISLIISRTRLINREQQKLERLLDLFRKYSGLLKLIEKENFLAPYLIDLKNKLKHGDVMSSPIMNKLTGILWGLEVRGNLIVSFFLNSFFLWDILLMIRLEHWRRNYRDSFSQWISIIAEFETLNSLANLSFNRPDLNWPEIRDGKFSMEIIQGGHPLINPVKRIDNSLTFHKDGHMYLITGANMAGKSTLLRMVGVNMVLAMAGGPVCAQRFTMVPVYIHTSVRTNDSLSDDESYFYAELKKLSSIIHRLEQGIPLFVIIDEMLKGTNSRDKHTGSTALIHRLMGLGASGLVATHDVELGNLEADYQGRIINRCFEVITDGNQLKFDYLLHPGISKNLNATFLMKQMGIIQA